MDVGAIIAAASAAGLFGALVLFVTQWRRARREYRRARRVDELIRADGPAALIEFRAGRARHVWPADPTCVNALCPYHFPCTVSRRAMCFHPECPLDGHPMTEAIPS